MAPQRRCVGCGRVAAKNELVRLALVPAQTRRRREQAARAGRRDRAGVVIDAAAKLPGRGAYLCRAERGPLPSGRCFELARKRSAIARTLHHPVKTDWSDLVESMSR
ncbi:MAG: YlxR family protein [Solirubrobacteraceae bacterium]